MDGTARNTQIFLFTSCKGGVGKSTVCANLAMSLATLGRRVLLIDCDFGNRCLDIITGLSNDALYDIGDVMMSRISPERAVTADKRNKNLFFIPAPYDFGENISPYAFRATVSAYARSGEYDYIFLDTPGGVGEPLMCAASVADTAFIIVSPTRAAVRAAERTADYLYSRGVRRQRLIVNKIGGKRPEDAKVYVADIIDKSRVQLIGCVPFDPEIIGAGDRGILTDELYSESVTRAFDNIARRMLGQNVPLFYKIRKLKRLH